MNAGACKREWKTKGARRKKAGLEVFFLFLHIPFETTALAVLTDLRLSAEAKNIAPPSRRLLAWCERSMRLLHAAAAGGLSHWQLAPPPPSPTPPTYTQTQPGDRCFNPFLSRFEHRSPAPPVISLSLRLLQWVTDSLSCRKRRPGGSEVTQWTNPL